MLINYQNLYKIQQINLHDSIFKEVRYDYFQKKIEVIVENKIWSTGNVSIEFKDVLYYEMTCCEFWGKGRSIICWSLMDTTNIYDKILRLEQVENAKSNSIDRTPMSLMEFLGSEFWMNSGDKLKIICKSIEIDDNLISKF